MKHVYNEACINEARIIKHTFELRAAQGLGLAVQLHLRVLVRQELLRHLRLLLLGLRRRVRRHGWEEEGEREEEEGGGGGGGGREQRNENAIFLGLWIFAVLYDGFIV